MASSVFSYCVLSEIIEKSSIIELYLDLYIRIHTELSSGVTGKSSLISWSVGTIKLSWMIRSIEFQHHEGEESGWFIHRLFIYLFFSLSHVLPSFVHYLSSICSLSIKHLVINQSIYLSSIYLLPILPVHLSYPSIHPFHLMTFKWHSQNNMVILF